MNEARTRSVGLLLVAIGSLAACGNGRAPNGASGDGGSANDAANVGPGAGCGLAKPAGPPLKHRASAIACGLSAPIAPHLSDAGYYIDASCQSDAACATDLSLTETCRAYPDADGATFCNADQCFTDEDCTGHGPCDCLYSDRSVGNLHACYPGNCQVDSDCGPGGYCSPSLESDCSHASPDNVTYLCHTAKDECANDSDCAACGAGAFCAVTQVGFWQCVPLSSIPECPSG